MSLPFFYSIWLVPFALTLLAWRAGLRAIAIAGVSKSSVQATTCRLWYFLLVRLPSKSFISRYELDMWTNSLRSIPSCG